MQKMNPSMVAAVAIAAALALPLGQAAFASTPQHVEILARDAHGRATRVRVDGQSYMVCTAKRQDECINPHAAGLSFGNRPLGHWPGKPASEMHG